MAEFSEPVITIQELQRQEVPYNASITELTFKGRQFKRYLSFSKGLLKAGVEYCKKALGRGELCFLVLEESSFTIWRSNQPLQSAEIRSLTQANATQTPRVQTTAPQASPQGIDAESLEHSRLPGAELLDQGFISPVNSEESSTSASIADPSQEQSKPPAPQVKRIYRGISY